ncbi:MAG TPA: tyrosinase family protein [Nostocaceae cyanobacterium]|nr:tyrosinase family protein [Nostocaceae cyanobacterium]
MSVTRNKKLTARVGKFVVATFGTLFTTIVMGGEIVLAHGAEHYQLPPIDAPTPPLVFPEPGSDANLKIRKNAVNLTPQEKADFVNAVDGLKNTFQEGSSISIYDEFVSLHVGVMGFMNELGGGTGPAAGANAAHALPAFLPWHREYVNRFEQALQTINPNVTVPYWDWTDPQALDVIFQDDFLGSRGTGTFIDIPGVGVFEGGVVQSGPFADWVLNEDIHIEPINLSSLGPKLLRFVEVPPFDKYPLSKAEIDKLQSIDNYEIFRAFLEGDTSVNLFGQLMPDWTLHDYAHGVIGGALVSDINIKPFPSNQTKILGTMNSILSSPYDPIFWLNHSNVDRLWAEWQDNGRTGSSFYPDKQAPRVPYGHNLNDPMWPWDGGLSTPSNFGNGTILSYLPKFASDDIVTPADMLDYRKLGYTYDTTRRVPVPEPTSYLGLLGLAALGLGAMYRRYYVQKTQIFASKKPGLLALKSETSEGKIPNLL